MSIQTTPGPPAAAPARPGPRARTAGALALLGQVPLWIWWALTDGGAERSHWLAGGIYLAVLASVLAVAVPPARPTRPAALALGGLWALVAWSAVSAAWAPDGGAALGGAAQAALPALALALPVLWPPPARAASGGLVALIGSVLLAGAVGLQRAAQDGSTLVDGRLTEPLGYPNAIAAFAVMGAVPALWMAAHGALPRWRRAACLAAAAAATSIGLLAQSRGGAAATVIVLAVAFALSPARLRLLAALAAVAVAVGAASGPLLGLRLDALEGAQGDSVERAVLATLAASALAAALSLLVARVPGALPGSSRRSSRTRSIARIAVGVVALVAIVAVTGGDPAGWVGDRVDSLRTPRYGELESPSSRTRFTGDLGSDRTDYWRVALELGASRPLGGAGAGSFAGEYVTRRNVDRYPWHAHSAPLETFAELGLPGALLALAALAGLAAGVARRRGVPGTPYDAVALALPAVALAAQSAVDWVASVPLLSASAAALAGAALASAAGADPPRAAARLRVGAGVVAALVALALVPPAIGARYEELAHQRWRTDPAAALAELGRAAAWQPLDARPRLAEGIVAIADRRPGLARSAFARAADRDANGWFARLELGLLLAKAGDVPGARTQIARARAINPREPIVRQAESSPSSLDPRATALRILASPG